MALIPSEPRKRNTLLVALGCAAAVYFFHTFWYASRKEGIDGLEARLEQLQGQNRRARLVAASGVPELQERLGAYERHLGRLEQLIPHREEVPSLLNSMALQARHTDVDLALMRPEPPEVGEFYTRQIYEIGVVGDYHNVGRFLAAIASLPRIVTPVDLELVPFEGARQMLEAEAPVEARFRIQTYVVPEPGDQSATGEGTTQPEGG